MSRLMRVMTMAMALVAPMGMGRAEDRVQVSVQADIDLFDAASVLALSAKFGNVEIKARSGWAAMTVPQRRVFIQVHPNCPPSVVTKDWGTMTIIERGEILRCHPDTRVVLVNRWERWEDRDRDDFLNRHPESRRRFEKVHGRGWHGGSHGRGNDGTRGAATSNDEQHGQGGNAKAKGDDRDEDKGDGKGKGRDKGKGHKHDAK